MPNLCIVPARALEDRTLTPRQLRALMAVGLYTNSAGKGVWASQRTMADRAGMSRQQMSECLRVLSAKGYIKKRRRWHGETGAEMTAIIDMLFDEPENHPDESPTPTPKVGSPPPPKLGVPPTPKVGTQTTQGNDSRSDDDTADAHESGDSLLGKLPAPYRDDAAHMLAEHRNPAALEAELVALNNGMHGAYSWETIGRAIHDMRVAGAAVTGRALRAFCEGVSHSTPTPTPKRPQGPDYAKLRAELEAADAPKA